MDRINIRPLFHRFSRSLQQIRSQRFFQDHLSLALILPALGFNIVTLLIMIFRLHPTNFSIPVHYSSIGGFDQLGPWYQTYWIAGFGFMVTLCNTALAAYGFGKSRIASFYLLTGAFVVALFCLIIGTAFAVVV
ncbi:MAG: hypothetical protein ACHQUB_03605 [Candidatus Saccharimonadia bacterium]